MTWKEKLIKANLLFAQAKELLIDPEATAEQKVNLEQMYEDALRLKKEAMTLKDIDEAMEVTTALQKADEKQKQLPNPQTGDYKDWGDFLHAVWCMGHPNARFHKADDRLVFHKDEDPEGHETKAMAEGAGSTGGFLVPAEFQAQLQAAMVENTIVRSRATRIRMRRRQVKMPVLDQTGTTAGVPHWFGGMTFYWGEEGAEKTETEAAFRQINLVVNKLYGLTHASDELVEDSAISLADFLSGPMGFAGGVSWMEDYAFLQGTGAGQPRGVLNAGATIAVARQAVGLVGFVDIANMMQNFMPSSRGVWVATQSLMSQLIQMNGPAGNPSYVWQPSARDGVPGYLMGMPLLWCEKMPLVGATGDIGLFDFRYYLIGDRQATTIESTKFARWVYDQTSWRVVHRVDGQPWLSAPLTYQDGTTQVSPFVVLGADT